MERLQGESSTDIAATRVRAKRNEPIAIIGIGCRFPGEADNPEAFWKLLCTGTNAISDVPADRWNPDGLQGPDSQTPGKGYAGRGGFLRQIDQFDASFFGISPREAASIDPQQRLLLEVAWEAFEDAGIVVEKLAGSSTGVFIGGFTLDYQLLQLGQASWETLETHTSTGVVMTMLANRLSYIFDFRGPSLVVDTACSSSLVAVHLACQSLWEGESSLALAGGVNIMISPNFTLAQSKGGFLSFQGQSRAFDAQADGYVRGEGAGIIILKPYARAQADGDPIYALIRATAINQDGRTHGLTVPNGASQEALLQQVYRQAAISPAAIHYVETHGTGTPVGDPIEARALGNVLAAGRSPDTPCLIGSVKTNIGHLEAAAGIAGLIKTVLCVKHRQIPPHLGLEQLNPAIPFATLSLRIPTTLEPWPVAASIARASVNAFGFGGTNAHVVVEEAVPEMQPTLDKDITSLPEHTHTYLIPLSARSPGALQAITQAYRALLENTTVNPGDLACSASMRRDHHEYRMALVGSSREELLSQLALSQDTEAQTRTISGRASRNNRRKLVFVCSGMGPQWYGMAQTLFRQEPIFRQALERCDAALLPYTGWSLVAELLADEASSRMAETEIAQPANFALQVALAELWNSWGIRPDAIVGHSAGEVAAAYLSQALTWEDAISVIYHRSRLQQRTTGQGRMMALGLSYQDVQNLLNASCENHISVAAINSPRSTSLVGDVHTLNIIAQILEKQGIFYRYLQGRVPYHSHYMDILYPEVIENLRNITPHPPAIPLYSSVTGSPVVDVLLDEQYWWKNIREPVFFAAAVESLIKDGYHTFLELGPHPVLASSIMECLSACGREGVVLPSLRRKETDRVVILSSLGALYTLGYPIHWQALYPGPYNPLRLTTYPWQRERYWSETDACQQARLGLLDHPVLGLRQDTPIPSWKRRVNKQSIPYLNDYQIMGRAILPAGAYIEMALAAADIIFGNGTYGLESITFHEELALVDECGTVLYTMLDTQKCTFTVHSEERGTDKKWTLHATLTICQA